MSSSLRLLRHFYGQVSCPRNKRTFRHRSVGCFSRRERRAYLESIRKERVTRKNSQLATAQRVAMKMGRRLRCSSVTYPLRYAPSTASPARTALSAAHFDRNETYAYFGDRTLAWAGAQRRPRNSSPPCD